MPDSVAYNSTRELTSLGATAQFANDNQHRLMTHPAIGSEHSLLSDHAREHPESIRVKARLQSDPAPLVDSHSIEDAILAYGRQFRQTAESYTGPQPISVITYGELPVLISAVHATPHVRNGTVKGAERLTGALATQLASSLNATSVLPVAPQPDDPNYDTDDTSAYKICLQQLFDTNRYRLLVDLHGMKDSWGSDICIGTGDARLHGLAHHVVTLLLDSCQFHGLTATINYPFSSHHYGTVSAFARRAHCAALQLELSLQCRSPGTLATTFSTIYHSLDAGLALASLP